jgi:hypothetical protein
MFYMSDGLVVFIRFYSMGLIVFYGFNCSCGFNFLSLSSNNSMHKHPIFFPFDNWPSFPQGGPLDSNAFYGHLVDPLRVKS